MFQLIKVNQKYIVSMLLIAEPFKDIIKKKKKVLISACSSLNERVLCVYVLCHFKFNDLSMFGLKKQV